VIVMRDTARFDFEARGWRSDADAALQAAYAASPLPVGKVGLDTLRAIRVLKSTPAVSQPPRPGAVYPAAPVGGALRQTAQLIRAALGTRCFFVDVQGDFDTHSNPAKNNRSDYAPLGQALAAFRTDLGPGVDKVLVLVVTEFGRAVYENGSLGTDHGTAGAMFALGGPVRGGRVHTRWPGLTKSQLHMERDVAATTDFRDVFIEAASRHLGIADAARLFPGHTPGRPLNFLT
jgi:uncharacterized protein (DUF1501 family)